MGENTQKAMLEFGLKVYELLNNREVAKIEELDSKTDTQILNEINDLKDNLENKIL